MKVINIRKEQILVFLYISIIVFGIVKSYNNETIQTFSMPASKKVVVIDAGHGGFDPGKVGDGDVYEKDINLAIAKKLQSYFEQSGATVIMTRTDDNALDGTKNDDMRARKDTINGAKGDILISIHQNSYETSDVRGAQVFYYSSEESEALATNIQDEFNREINASNTKNQTENDTYYLLKETNIPAVIVESGFLSNPEESKLLSTEEYQDKVAWSIYVGTINYFNSLESH